MGNLVIRQGVMWLKGSHWFCAAMDRILAAFPPEHQALRDTIFAAYSYLQLVDLTGLDEDEFNVFYRAAEDALGNLPAEAKARAERCVSEVMATPKKQRQMMARPGKMRRRLVAIDSWQSDMARLWNELLSVLRRDPRYRPHESGERLA